jgi:signal transduction histidine kinase
MNRSARLKVLAFAGSIALLVCVFFLTAAISWQRVGELRSRLTKVQAESQRIANQFQDFLNRLNGALIRYGVTHQQTDWQHFLDDSEALDHWIDLQKPKLITDREKQAMEAIDQAYDDYRASADQIHANAQRSAQVATSLSDFSRFHETSEHLEGLGVDLANAHRERNNALLADSSRALGYLSLLLLGSFGLLLVFGTGLGIWVYRDLIAPLRMKLVESQALAERHEKLASLGMLAAGIAHEIRNPLTAIKACLFLQQKKALPGSQEATDFQVANREIARLENIVQDFLRFARPAEPDLRLVSVGEPLQQVHRLLAPQLAKNKVTLVLEDVPAAFAKMDLNQVQQVLINLVQNAAESIGQDGKVTLRARFDSRPLHGKATDVVVLEVEDTGKGIPPEVEKRLFDPFFTTKDTGTGLGLSIVARIVEKHGGALQYRTQVHRGTTFGVVLPRVESPARPG